MVKAQGLIGQINVVRTATDRQVTVVLRGDLDAASAGSLSAALEATEAAHHLVIDLSATDFVDIAGMRAFADCAARRHRRGLELVLVAAPASAMTILRMMPRQPRLRCEPRVA